MTTTKAKLEFVFALARHTSATVRQCEALMRYAATLQRLAVQECNGPWDVLNDAGKRRRVQQKVTALCLEIEGAAVPAKFKGPWRTTCPQCGLIQQGRQLCNECGTVCPSETPRCVPVFSNDPRGSVLKIRTPDNYSNDFGGEGIVVPS